MKDYNPKVFISYCQENVDFSDKVLDFSNKLRLEGIDTILDQYEECPSEGWPRWMENSISTSDFVLVICTEEYLNRLMYKTDTGIGKGVKWESNIIYQHVYNNESINQKFIPIVFNHKNTSFIPLPLQGTTFYNVSDKNRYDQLYWRLRGIKVNEKPELGKLRPLPSKERNSLFIASPIDVEAWDKAKWRGAAFFMDQSNENLPYFLLPFTKENAAKKIFADWRSMYGEEDENDEIRIALIEGDIPGMERGYSIHISANIDRVFDRMIKTGIDPEDGMILSISRTQRANPTDNFKMYNMFKSQYLAHEKYLLAPAVIDETKGTIKPLFDLSILKKNIVFRNSKEIDKNDPDYTVFLHAKTQQYK